MITQLTEPSINKSVMNRHSCLSHHKQRIVNRAAANPVKPIIKSMLKKIQQCPVVKEEPKIESVKEIIGEETITQPIEELPQQTIIEEKISMKPVEIDPMESAVQSAVKEVPIERKIEIEQRNSTKIHDNMVRNTGHYYTYNPLLGSRILHN